MEQILMQVQPNTLALDSRPLYGVRRRTICTDPIHGTQKLCQNECVS